MGLQKGWCKYYGVKQQQDYWSWHSRQSKDWLDDFEFGLALKDVFKQYKEMSCGLADEVLFSVNETMATTQVEAVVKRIQRIDMDMLDLIMRVGSTYCTKITDSVEGDIKEALIRLKSRGLIVPRREESGYYKYGITELGFNVLDEYE